MSNFISHSRSVTVPRGGRINSGGTSKFDEVVGIPDYDKIDISHSYKSTGILGPINPCFCVNLSKGDHLEVDGKMSQRFQPLVSPAMTQLDTHCHFYGVPYSVLDYGYRAFNTGGPNGDYNRPLLHVDFSVGMSFGSYTGNHFATPVSVKQIKPSSPGTVEPSVVRYNGKTLFGPDSLWQGFNLPVLHYSLNNATSRIADVFGQDTPVMSTLRPLIAYSRVYNEYYRAEYVEVDEWTSEHTGLTLSDVAHTAALGIAQGSLTGFLDFIRTNMPAGWMDFVLFLLTDPRNAWVDNEETEWYQYGSNQISIPDSGIPFDMVTGQALSGESRLTQNSAQLDLAIYAFCMNLFAARLAPWERQRSNLMLPFLQSGTLAAVRMPNLVDTAVSSATGVTTSNVEQERIAETNTRINRVKVGSQFLDTRLTLNDIRRVSALTRFLETTAIVGYRWDEWLKGLFGITTKEVDYTKPYYYGGMKAGSNIDKVDSTADSGEMSVGDFTGQAFTGTTMSKLSVSAPEDYLVIGLYYTKPMSSFLYGFDRNNVKFAAREQFYLAPFAHLQEQPVYDIEFGTPSGADMAVTRQVIRAINQDESAYSAMRNHVLGYEPRYTEYKIGKDHIGGELKGNLRYWTNARDESNSAISNDARWQHVDPSSDALKRIFQIDPELADSFLISFGWSANVLTEVPEENLHDYL